MKRAVILHGTGSQPDANWYPWLKQQLEHAGFDVWVPQLPDSARPNRATYNNLLFSSGWNFADNVVVGHSSGAVAVLNMLMDGRCPHIRQGVMVGAWRDNDWDVSEDRLRFYADEGISEDQFSQLFPPDGFDFQVMSNRADRLTFVHGADDPYCPVGDAQWLAEQLRAQLVVTPQGGHFSGGYLELPEVWQAITADVH